MAVFALENGKLVGAPSINDADEQVTGDVLGAVRDQVLSLIERPLFGVGWVTADRRDNNQESLIALEASGQIVTIEVVGELDARGLIAAAARAGRYSEYTRRQLVEVYSHGTVEFTKDWNEFLDLTPPVAGKGPRLYLFISTLSDDVREPLLALMGIGVEAQHIIMHPGANGILVELSDISRNRPHLLRARAVATAIEAGGEVAGGEVAGAGSAGPAGMVGTHVAGGGGEDPANSAPSADSPPSVSSAPSASSAVSAASASAPTPDDAAPVINEPSPDVADVADGNTPATSQEPTTDAWGIEKSEWDISGWGTTPQLPNLGFGAPPPKREPIVVPEKFRRTDEPVGESPADGADSADVDESQTPPPRRDTAIMLAERSGQITKSDDEAPLRRSGRRKRRRRRRDEATPGMAVRDEARREEVAQEEVAAESSAAAKTATEQAAVKTASENTAAEQPRAPRAPSALSADDLSAFAVSAESAPVRTLYDDVVDSSKRAEQLLWEKAAPQHSNAAFISEDDSARAAALAVARAAGDVPLIGGDVPVSAEAGLVTAKPVKTEPVKTEPVLAEPAHAEPTEGSKRIKNIVNRLGGEAKISWVFPRRGIDLHATLSRDGFIVMPDGRRFNDPAEAARSVADIGSLDAWRGWRTPDGRRIGNI